MDDIASRVLTALTTWQGSFYALTKSDLCGLVGCSERELRAAVGTLRRNGHLVVVAPGGGYRLAESIEEVDGFISAMRERIAALQTVVEAMESSAAQAFGRGRE